MEIRVVYFTMLATLEWAHLQTFGGFLKGHVHRDILKCDDKRRDTLVFFHDSVGSRIPIATI